ncbi:MAG: Holliday junction branch migration protein RuvA [Phycisphaerales bacterium]
MIRRITGRLAAVELGREPIAEVEISPGVVLEVLAPAYLAERLSGRTGEVTLHTKTVLESTTQGASFVPRLIGFESAADRKFFELMTGVKGLGTRKALRAMTIEPAAIAGAVSREDAKALEKLPEIGKRLAQTIVAELSGKVDGFLTGVEIASLDAAAVSEPKGLPGIAGEAVEALVALGEGRADAERKIQAVLAKDGSIESVDALVGAAFGR